MARFGEIHQALDVVDRAVGVSARFGMIWRSLVCVGKILQDLARFGKIRHDISIVDILRGSARFRRRRAT